jgi:hypothetical protein
MNLDNFRFHVSARVGDQIVTVGADTYEKAWFAEQVIRNMASQFGLTVHVVTITVNDMPRWECAA